MMALQMKSADDEESELRDSFTVSILIFYYLCNHFKYNYFISKT